MRNIITGLFFCIISAAADFIVYHFINSGYPLLATFLWITGLLSFLYLLVFVAVFAFYSPKLQSIKWGLFIFLAISLPKLVFTAYWLIGILPLTFYPPAREISMYIGLSLEALVLIVMLYGVFIGSTSIRTKYITIESERVPENFNGFRIVHFSDFHLGTFEHRKGFVKKAVRKINHLHGDMIAFTGDLVNEKSSEIDPFKDILSEIEAPHGVYSVLGNHDYSDYHHWENNRDRIRNLKHLLSAEREMGWTLLNDESRYIRIENQRIAVIGVENWGNPPFKKYGDLMAASSGIPPETFSILLSHNPVHWRAEVLPLTRIDLMLSGHTHAAQLKLGKWSPATRRYPEWAGLYKEGNRFLYINQGLGSVFFPIRIGAHPELTLIRLKNKNGATI